MVGTILQIMFRLKTKLSTNRSEVRRKIKTNQEMIALAYTRTHTHSLSPSLSLIDFDCIGANSATPVNYEVFTINDPIFRYMQGDFKRFIF